METLIKKNPEENADQIRMEYLLGILAQREEAITEYESKDSFFHNKVFISEEQAHGFETHLQDLLSSREHFLGSGQTARVKSLHVDGFDPPIAVKYLITPTAKTLSAQGEHDMLYEVEVVTSVEKHETEKGIGNYIRVPHPYFYYKRGSMQCYGMSQVNGVRLDQIMQDDGAYHPLRDAVIARLRERYGSPEETSALLSEVEPFMKAVHEVCLHGDLAPRNIMVDTDGVFYLIDFGQSVSARLETEDAREQFDNLRAHEPELMTECIRGVLNHVRPAAAQRAA
jgi:serine/threonine protein kinase